MPVAGAYLQSASWPAAGHRYRVGQFLAHTKCTRHRRLRQRTGVGVQAYPEVWVELGEGCHALKACRVCRLLGRVAPRQPHLVLHVVATVSANRITLTVSAQLPAGRVRQHTSLRCTRTRSEAAPRFVEDRAKLDRIDVPPLSHRRLDSAVRERWKTRTRADGGGCISPASGCGALRTGEHARSIDVRLGSNC